MEEWDERIGYKERVIQEKEFINFIIFLICFVGFIILVFFMSVYNWHFILFKETCIKKFDGKEYLGIASYSIRLRKTVTYYEEYNFLAYHKTDECIVEFYDHDDYKQPEYRAYYKVPKEDSRIYYYDEYGNVSKICKYNEKGSIIDI